MSGASFKGNLEVLNLSDIFQSLAMNRHSGTLIIFDGKREKKIFFAEGEIQLLSSSRRMKLGELLVSTGKISDDDLDLALKLQKQNRKKLGEILVEEGFCSEDDIARIVKFQIEEEIYDLFLWRKADFEFIADHLPDDMKKASPNVMRLNLNTNSLIMEALRRLDEWELVKQAVPSTKEVFEVKDMRKLERIELPDRLKNEIHLIDGKTNVEGLAEKTMVSEFELCKLLADLVHQGAIQALSMESLVQKAEEAYAVNDFMAAASLYSRLAELAPGEPKVLVPLAESLRRSGDDRQALLIFEELARKLDPVRDAERLRRCYETIVALDPERQDVVRKLNDLNAQATAKRRSVTVPILVGALAVVGLLGLVFRARIAAIIHDLRKDPKAEQRLLDERLAGSLLEEMNAAQNIEKNPKRWHELGVKIWKEFPATLAREKVLLPILVRTEPVGYAISVNGLPKGVTTSAEPVVVGTYTTLVDAVKVQVRKHVPGVPSNQDTPALLEKVIADPHAWPGEIVFKIEDRPELSYLADSPIEAELRYYPAQKAWVSVGRDGTIYALDESLKRLPDWKDAVAGQFGDVFSDATIVGDLAYVGGSHGGLAVVDLAARKASTGSFPVESGSVRGRPLVLARAGRVIFGTTTGAIYGFSLEGTRGASPTDPARGARWRQDVDGVIEFPGVLRDDEGSAVVFASTDERLRAFDSASGKPLWAKPPLVGTPVAPLARVGDAIYVATSDGELVAVSTKDGKVKEPRYREPTGKRFTFLVDDDGKRVFIATADAKVRALDITAGFAPIWKQDFAAAATNPSGEVPTLGLLPAGGVGSAAIGEQLFVSVGVGHPIALDTRTGLLAWQGSLDDGGTVVGPPAVSGNVFLLTTSTGSVHLFRRH